MVLDTTVMNVSISQVVEDLNTTVVGLQSAITIYTLVMASFMLLGGKLGDRWGAKRAFAIGLVIYGIGSFITAISQNLTTLLIGWSIIEGLGAALVIPAIAALTASTYQGKQRALAYGVLGGVAGASAAAGPLIGGWVGTMYSWRYVFAGETVVVAILMIFLFLIPSVKGKGASLDPVGAVLSIAGLALGVFAILRSSQWGWILPGPKPLTINGEQVNPLGLSPVLWLLIASGFLLTAFVRHEYKVMESGGEPLVDLNLLKIPALRAGLIMIGAQQFIIMATFFVLPLYLQSVLGFDAFKTGVAILPLSIALLDLRARGCRAFLKAADSADRSDGDYCDARWRGRHACDDRRRAPDVGLRPRPGARRRWPWPARLSTRQRHHVRGAAKEHQRGRRSPGHGTEPWRVPWHRAHWCGAHRGVVHDLRLHHSGSAEPLRGGAT